VADFVEPKVIEDINETKNFVFAKCQLKNRWYQSQPQDFYQKVERNGKTKYQFIGMLHNGKNQLLAIGNNSTNRPTYAKELADNLKNNDWVIFKGKLSEYVRDGIPRRSIAVTQYQKLDGVSQDGSKIRCFLTGKLTSSPIDKSDSVVFKIGIPWFNDPSQQNEFEVTAVKGDEYTKWFLDKKLGTGDLLAIETKPINTYEKYENGETKITNENRLIAILGFAKGQAVVEESKDENEVPGVVFPF
jgi:hypothetical protein